MNSINSIIINYSISSINNSSNVSLAIALIASKIALIASLT